MIRKELKFNLKSFSIWTLLIVLLFLIVLIAYPSIVNGENIKVLDEMMSAFPKELMAAFNMDIASISTAFGWLKSEGFVMILLVTGCYAAILGSNILLKEENDKTIEYLNSLPISREKIVLSKALVGIIYVVLMIVILGVFNYIALLVNDSFDQKQYILLSITPLLSSLVIYAICLFVSTFFHKTKKMIGISLGIVFISYLLGTLAGIDESVEGLKYLSVFTLADIRNVIINIKIEPIMIIISSFLTIIFVILTVIRYKKKSLV